MEFNRRNRKVIEEIERLMRLGKPAETIRDELVARGFDGSIIDGVGGGFPGISDGAALDALQSIQSEMEARIKRAEEEDLEAAAHGMLEDNIKKVKAEEVAYQLDQARQDSIKADDRKEQLRVEEDRNMREDAEEDVRQERLRKAEEERRADRDKAESYFKR